MVQEVRSRRRGRELEEAIYQAVWDELREHGFTRLTMDGVARRAGTSKPVLYRRWANRVEMLAAAATHFLPDSETVPDAGSLRANTIAVLKVMRERMRTTGRTTMLGLLTEIAANPEANAPVIETFIGFMRKIMTEVALARAVDRGEIEEEQITTRLRTLPLELARMEFIVTGDLPDVSIEEIVDTVFLPALEARRR
ncbi:TetR/AcrR family transcriptional regulator [Glycomyces sp. L485]|uniref:TetR/AcrR family transcriptional regulator n=1 Tax=Glycomyces sp. L485 TaxID=2909235 RepID=UPI001F4B9DE1|nr:TetR/AcrR family transcriptional regulator [Glycomyces sp. L485]MCH7232581.1 TetR/AcrR family transcriptional regulator [Glycomyces sp. L485]